MTFRIHNTVLTLRFGFFAALAVLLTLACYGLHTRANLKPTWLFIGIVALGLGAGLTLA